MTGKLSFGYTSMGRNGITVRVATPIPTRKTSRGSNGGSRGTNNNLVRHCSRALINCSTQYLHNEDPVCTLYGGQPVSYEDNTAAFCCPIQRILHQSLALDVQRRGRLVKQQNLFPRDRKISTMEPCKIWTPAPNGSGFRAKIYACKRPDAFIFCKEVTRDNPECVISVR